MTGVFTAETNSVSATLNFIIYYLCKYSKVKEQMIEEIEKCTGKDPQGIINFNNLEKLNYCEAVIKEVTRFQPILIAILKIISEDDEIADYKWSAGQEIILNL